MIQYKCEKCKKELTLEQADKNYNSYKVVYCDECLTIIEDSDGRRVG